MGREREESQRSLGGGYGCRGGGTHDASDAGIHVISVIFPMYVMEVELHVAHIMQVLACLQTRTHVHKMQTALIVLHAYARLL